MKMKRLFKFFAIAAIIAVGFTGCTSEEPVGTDPDDNGQVNPAGSAGEDTYVTLNFTSNGKPITKSQVEPDNAANEVTTYTNLRITIFNDADEKEVDEYYTAIPTNLTFKVISGTKRLFVIANYPTTWNDATGLLKEPLAINGVATNNTGITTLSAWNAVYSLDASNTPTTASLDGTKMQGLLASLTLSNVAGNTHNLVSGITADQSQQTTSTNNVSIEIKRAVAKMFVSQTPGSKPANSSAPAGTTITKDSFGIISTTGIVPTYRVMNVLAYLYPFQIKNGTTPITPYADVLAAVSDPTNNAAVDAIVTPRFDRGIVVPDTLGVGKSSPPDVPIIVSANPTPTAGGSYYITENVNSKERAGTFAVIKAQFTPTKTKHITGADFNNTSGGKFTPTIATADATPGTFYLLKNLGSNVTTTGVSANTVIAGTDAAAVARKIIYHLENPATAEQALTYYTTTLVPQAKFDSYIATYTNGICYYRLNVGTTKVQGLIVPSVERNTHYQLNIDAYTKLGAVNPADLLGTGNNVGETYLTITVSIRAWDIVNQGQDV
jgi:hypothetical protein